MINIIDEFDQFFNRLSDCNTVHDKLEQSLDAICDVQVVANLQKTVADLQLLESEFSAYINDIRVLHSAKLKFVDKINKFEDNRVRFCQWVENYSVW